MSIEKVKAYFSSLGEAERILEFAQSTATVELAAEAVGCTPGMIAKSMTFLVDGAPLLVVLAGDVRVDNHKFKAAFHRKGRMIPFDAVEGYIGHRRAASVRSASRKAFPCTSMPRSAASRQFTRRLATTTAPSA